MNVAARRPGGPLGRIAAGTLISSIGSGAWFTTWAVFLTRSVGLTPAQVGIGMTIAAALGVVCTPAFGRLGDAAGARPTFTAQLAIQGAAAAAYLAVDGFVAFLVVTAVAQIGSSGSGGPRNALVLGLAERPDRDPELDPDPASDRAGRDPTRAGVAALSRMRAISHVGWALGAALGGIGLTIGTRPAFLALVAVNAASYLAYAALVATVPRARTAAPATSAAGVRRPPAPRRVTRDAPYLALAGMTGTLALCWAMLSSGLPLWVALHTRAPQAISAVVVVISSLGIAVLQVPVSRRVTTPRAAAGVALGSGTALAAACLTLALTGGLGGPAAIALILAAALLHVTGELLFVAASWGLSVPLMPAGAPSEYQGAFATGESLALMIAPTLMTTLVADWGRPGWLVLAAVFLAPAVAIGPTTRWALRTRQRPADPADPATPEPAPSR